MTRHPLRLAGLAAALAFAATAAHAQSLREAVFAHAATASGPPAPAAAMSVRLADPDGLAPLPPGVARTALDRRFGKDGAMASVGFLCGLDSRIEQGGAMRAYGDDPQGRFVGAKLHLSFR
jgi:hypothetical protein